MVIKFSEMYSDLIVNEVPQGIDRYEEDIADNGFIALYCKENITSTKGDKNGKRL